MGICKKRKVEKPFDCLLMSQSEEAAIRVIERLSFPEHQLSGLSFLLNHCF